SREDLQALENRLSVRCRCQAVLRLRLDQAGQKGRCPSCQTPVRVPPAEAFLSRNGYAFALDEEAPSATGQGLWRAGAVVDGKCAARGKLGEGSFGAVWHVWHREWGVDLAVKELRTDRHASARRRENFERECQAWIEQLDLHPHIATAWYVRELF